MPTPYLEQSKYIQDLLAKGYDAEVAFVAGKMDRGVAADEKIGFEIQSVLDIYAAGDDGLRQRTTTIIPVIHTILPIISVQPVSLFDTVTA